MKGKCYDQVPYCPMAHALSLVGERWSLLIVRELLHGPRRYTDLANGLPGIGTNILAARLRNLTEHGILETAPASDGSAYQEYVLTKKGLALFPLLVALRQWGEEHFFEPDEEHVRLVDLKTGQVMWVNYAVAGPGADMREDAGAQSLVESLLKDAPLSVNPNVAP